MSSSNRHPLSGKVEVNEFVVGQQEEGVVGRKNKSKKLVIIAIEREKGGAKHIYAQIRSDGFSTYRSLTKLMPNLIVRMVGEKREEF